jgi:hypothetical protein
VFLNETNLTSYTVTKQIYCISEKGLRRIFVPKSNEVSEENSIANTSIICSPDQVLLNKGVTDERDM